MDQSLVLTSEGCNRHFRCKSRRCSLGCTGLCRPQARTAIALECRRSLCLLPVAAVLAVVEGRSLVEKRGKAPFVAVGLDRRRKMAGMASTVVRTRLPSPEVSAVVGVGECVEGRGRGMTVRSGNADFSQSITPNASCPRCLLRTYVLLSVFVGNEPSALDGVYRCSLRKNDDFNDPNEFSHFSHTRNLSQTHER